MSLYDENILDNPFFSNLLLQKDFLDEVISHKLTVCVPCIGSYNKKHTFTAEDFESHTLCRNEAEGGTFKTYNNKTLKVVNKGFRISESLGAEKDVRSLFEETVFIDDTRFVNVACIDSRFDSIVGTTYSEIQCDTLEQCTAFLFEENTPLARSKLDDILQQSVVSHKSTGMTLKHLISNTRKTFAKCLDIVERDFHFSRKMLTHTHFQMYLELSVESYVMSYLHQTIFRELCYVVCGDDSVLNRTLRNLCQVRPSEIEDLNAVFFSSLPTAQAKLSALNSKQSPREKISVLCECLTTLPDASTTGRAMSMDDLLPLLNYLIIKSEIPNWLANMCYMTSFTLTPYTRDERHGFTLVCFEASLTHVKDGNLDFLTAPVDQDGVETVSIYDPAFTPLQILQNCVLLNRVEDLTRILSMDDSLTPTTPPSKRCHPLCSCDSCENRALSLRWRDLTVHTPYNTAGVSLLHIAAQNNYTDLISYLLSEGARVDCVDSAGRTALHQAAQRATCVRAVRVLLGARADVNLGDYQGRGPLHEAAERGHTEILQAMVEGDLQMKINTDSNNGDTPLHLAARYGYSDIVTLLLDHGASMSIKNSKGETPLATAHSKHISNIIQSYSTSLDEWEQVKARSVTRNTTHEQEKLFRLCSQGDLQMIKHKLNLRDFCLSNFTRPRLKSIKQKCHPLCQCEECAETVQQSAVSRSLLCNSDSYTLLHISALYGHPDLSLLFAGHFSWMLDSVTSRHKLSPLHLACQYNNEAIVDILITAGCDVNSVNAQGNTPLHYTCTNGHTGCALLLLSSTLCDISLGNDRGDTPLHCAARWGHISLVNLLLKHSASPDLKNRDGLLPLHLSQFDEVCEALRRSMGLVSVPQSEDDTNYTDCNSHFSSPAVLRREQEVGGRPEEGGNVPEGTEVGNVPEGTEVGNVPEGTEVGNVPEGTEVGNVPEGTEVGNVPESSSPICTELEDKLTFYEPALLEECLAGEGEDWVLENRPLSFCEN